MFSLTRQFRAHGFMIRKHSSQAYQRKKHPQRGGQNLTERYVRLEKSLRGKEALEAEYGELQRSTLTGPSDAISPSAGKAADTFKGLVIPERPREPQSDECCMSGCAICVYDLYEESLDAYRDAVAKVTATLDTMRVPLSDRPRSLQDCSTTAERKKDVTLSVFEEMERALQGKKGSSGSMEASAMAQQILVKPQNRTRSSSKASIWSLSEVYEGLRWLLFSNR